MKDLMMLYGVTLGRRFHEKQKTYFINQVESSYSKFGFPTEIHRSQNLGVTIRNIMAGDLNQADIVFAAAYDTPASSLLPNMRFYPFQISKNLKQERLNFLVRLMFLIVLALIAYFCVQLFGRSEGLWKALYLLLLVLTVGFAVFFGSERANRFNFNRNSASLAVMHKIAEQCKNNPRIAFAFFDRSVSSFAGIKAFKEQFEFQNKTLIFLDSVAEGETLLVAHHAEMNSSAKKVISNASAIGLTVSERTYCGSKMKDNILDLQNGMLYFVSGTVAGKEFYVENVNSKKDVKVDMERLSKIAESLINFVNSDMREAEK